MKEDGFAVKLLTEDPLDRDFYGAMENPGDSTVNPVKFVRALVDASSAQVFENETVCKIDSDGNSVLVNTTKRTFKAQRCLVTTNAYTPLLLSDFIDKIKPARGQAFVTQPLRKRVLEKPCYANYGWEYFRQLSDNRFILGGSRQLFMNEEFGYADMITKPIQSALEGYLKDRFPDVAGVPIVQRWSGIMAFTADGLPLVGELDKSGVFFAVGFNGHGFGYGINMCKLLVDVAMDGCDAGVFNAERPSLTGKKPVAASQEKGP
jgi:glycine/D-amino acid oxidase-like deaminating enzyme